MGTTLAIGLALAIALFSVIGNYAREMYKEHKYREMFGAIFCAVLPIAVFGIFWAATESPSEMARNITLGIVGAVLGASGLIWLGYAARPTVSKSPSSLRLQVDHLVHGGTLQGRPDIWPVTYLVSVINASAYPVIARNWEVTAELNGKKHTGRIEFVPKDVGFDAYQDGKVVSVVLGSDEQIFVKMAKKPIDAGHVMQGFLFASFQDIELREHDRAKNGDGVRMVLRCEDGAGNEARIESVLTGEKGPYNYQPQLNPKFEPKR